MKLYRGVIEDNDDPEKLGRCRVRVFGIHTENNELSGKFDYISTEQLPWAEVLQMNLVSGVGISSILKKGTWVFIIFDNDDLGFPIILGTCIGKNTQKTDYKSGTGFCDPTGKYPLESRSDINSLLDEKYTKLSVIQTESGHVIELDDSDGDQRINISHTSGSNILIDNLGNMIINCVGDIIYNNTGKFTINSGGNFSVSAPRIDLN